MTGQTRIVFGGDRAIALRVLNFLMEDNCVPQCLILPGPDKASHAAEMIQRYREGGGSVVYSGAEVLSGAAWERIAAIAPDYLILVHLQLKVPPSLLGIPKYGVLNLHPAYLPFNRGWHTPTWAMLDRTPYGATLHFMSEAIDEGDIVHQRRVEIDPDDTAHSLYRKALDLEFEVFREAWPWLKDGSYRRKPQASPEATAHRKRDLAASGVQRLDLDAQARIGEVLDRLRALTTNRVDEACFFDSAGRRYRVRLEIVPEESL